MDRLYKDCANFVLVSDIGQDYSKPYKIKSEWGERDRKIIGDNFAICLNAVFQKKDLVMGQTELSIKDIPTRVGSEVLEYMPPDCETQRKHEELCGREGHNWREGY